MTSIKNDAFTVGTAAVAAGVTNIAAQKSGAIRGLAVAAKNVCVNGAKAAVNKDTYVKAYKATVKKDNYVKAYKAVVNKDNYVKAYKTALEKLSSVNWKTVGKYAGVAALVATAAVVAKNIIFPSDKA